MGDGLSTRELAETPGWSPTHTWRRTKLEGFPAPTGTRRTGNGRAIVSLWDVDEVRAWEFLMRAERLAHRDTV